MCEISFGHRCDPNDIAIAKHANSVRDTLRTTPLLDRITSAHAFERRGTEKPAHISMGPSFFLDAEDESAHSGDESHDSTRDEQGHSCNSRSSSSDDCYESHYSSDTDMSNDSE